MGIHYPIHTLSTLGMEPASGSSALVRVVELAALPARAAPGEPDTPQLLAAEQVGLFAYPYAADSDSVKGHTP